MVRANKREAYVKATKLFAKGLPASEVAKRVGVSPITARTWKARTASTTETVTRITSTVSNVLDLLNAEIEKRRKAIAALEQVKQELS